MRVGGPQTNYHTSPAALTPAPTTNADPDPWDVGGVDVDGVASDIIELHPRNPEQTMTASEDGGVPEGETPPSGTERPWWTEKPVQASILAGFGKNAVDVARLVKKYPEALRTGNLTTAIQQTLLTAPDARIIDPAVKGLDAAKTAGRTFDAFDDKMMKASTAFAAFMSPVQFLSAFPSLGNSLLGKDGGVDNLATTAEGRAGVLQLIGGGIGLHMLNQARLQTAGGAASGLIGRLSAMGSAPIMADPMLTKIGLVSGLSVTLNELGYLDVLNENDPRSVSEKLGDAAHGTPVLNDSLLRTGALGGIGTLMGAKAIQSVKAAGSLGGLSTGQRFGLPIVAGLAGASLLGGLDFLNAD